MSQRQYLQFCPLLFNKAHLQIKSHCIQFKLKATFESYARVLKIWLSSHVCLGGRSFYQKDTPVCLTSSEEQVRAQHAIFWDFDASRHSGPGTLPESHILIKSEENHKQATQSVTITLIDVYSEIAQPGTLVPRVVHCIEKNIKWTKENN